MFYFLFFLFLSFLHLSFLLLFPFCLQSFLFFQLFLFIFLFQFHRIRRFWRNWWFIWSLLCFFLCLLKYQNKNYEIFKFCYLYERFPSTLFTIWIVVHIQTLIRIDQIMLNTIQCV